MFSDRALLENPGVEAEKWTGPRPILLVAKGIYNPHCVGAYLSFSNRLGLGMSLKLF